MSDTSTTKLDELQQAYYVATDERQKLEYKRSSELREAISEFEHKFRKEVLDPKYDGLLKAARDKEYEVQRNLGVERDRVALESAKDLEWPVGTRSVKWNTYSWTSGSAGPRYYPLNEGVIAILEIFTSKSLRPERARVSNFLIGQPVLRILKKDGTPSARFIEQVQNFCGRGCSFSLWFPEGVDPNTKE